MNDVVTPLDDEAPTQVTEMDMLKQRATMMGIQFSNNIGIETLRKKIQEKMDGVPEVPETETPPLVAPAVLTKEAEPVAPVKPISLRNYLLAEATKLIRIRISCMDPKKQDIPGEYFTVANEHIGTIRKYVPFGESTDGGYHVPACILEMLRSREFLHIKTETHPVTKAISVKTRYVREFSIEVLPPLTPEQIRRLAADQTSSGRLQDRD